jgi:hypothetical protein
MRQMVGLPEQRPEPVHHFFGMCFPAFGKPGMQARLESSKALHHTLENCHAAVAAAENAGEAFSLPLVLLFFDGCIG